MGNVRSLENKVDELTALTAHVTSFTRTQPDSRSDNLTPSL